MPGQHSYMFLSLPLQCLPRGHADHGRVLSASGEILKHKTWQAMASSPKTLKLRPDVQSHLIFLLKMLWPVADDFFSPVFQIPVLKVCQHRLAFPRTLQNCWPFPSYHSGLEKATASWFSFQTSWKDWKSTPNLQQKGRKYKEKTRTSPTLNQEGLLPAWVGWEGN